MHPIEPDIIIEYDDERLERIRTVIIDSFFEDPPPTKRELLAFLRYLDDHRDRDKTAARPPRARRSSGTKI